MTDTPITPPATKSERLKAFIGDLARPFAIYVTTACAGASFIIIALRVENGNDGAIFLGGVGLIVGALIGARAAENINSAKRSAEVEIAKATSTPS